MARLARDKSPDGHASDDSDFATQLKNVSLTGKARTQTRISPRKRTAPSYRLPLESEDDEDLPEPAVLLPKTSPKKIQRQIQLKPLNASASSGAIRPPLALQPASPRKKQLPLTRPVTKVDTPEPTQSTPEIEVEVEESIWCGSGSNSDDSDDELPSPRKLLVGLRRPPKKLGSNDSIFQTRHTTQRSVHELPVNSSDSENPFRLRQLPSKLRATSVDINSRPASSSDKENQGAFLGFSPPRLYSPSKPTARPVTPPQSPSKSRLQSPSKKAMRIPTPPLRPSLDAFWNADTVNDWNEQYSPKKILKSPRKLKSLPDDNSQSPPSSPRRSQSPSKRSKAQRDAKKSFADSKHRLAEGFLIELDQTITQGQIAQLTASAGGVRLIWSKTLNSTAGRANWRKETTKTRQLDGTSTTTFKHTASIELAEKVIDDENRLLNVLAHEFCHLANFIVSGIKDQPHGKQFKDWGRKCTLAFGDRGVEVTTKHSYEIEYKFIWQCTDCGAEFKRHSKSIDITRKVCGCRGKLVQIKPVPRKENAGGNGYAGYVKANFAEVKKSLPGASQKVVMEAVGRKYRAEKEAVANVSVDRASQDALEKLASAVEVITLDDD